MHSAESLLKGSETAPVLFTGDRCEKVKLTEYWEGKIFGKFSPVTVMQGNRMADIQPVWLYDSLPTTTERSLIYNYINASRTKQ